MMQMLLAILGAWSYLTDTQYSHMSSSWFPAKTCWEMVKGPKDGISSDWGSMLTSMLRLTLFEQHLVELNIYSSWAALGFSLLELWTGPKPRLRSNKILLWQDTTICTICVIAGHKAFLCSTNARFCPLVKVERLIFSEMFIKYQNTSLTSDHGGFMMLWRQLHTIDQCKSSADEWSYCRFDPEVTTQWSIAVRRNGVQPPRFLGTSTTWAYELWREIARVLTRWSAVMVRWGWVFGLDGSCHLGCMVLWLKQKIPDLNTSHSQFSTADCKNISIL